MAPNSLLLREKSLAIENGMVEVFEHLNRPFEDPRGGEGTIWALRCTKVVAPLVNRSVESSLSRFHAHESTAVARDEAKFESMSWTRRFCHLKHLSRWKWREFELELDSVRERHVHPPPHAPPPHSCAII